MRSEPLTPGRREWLITAYLAYQGRTKPLTRAERLREPSTQGFRASQIMTDLVWDDPEAAWSVLLELIQRARTRHQLDMIAIGPLASFISTHWETWIDRLEERATNDARLRYCLSSVHASALPAAYQARVTRLADALLPDDVRT
jgi:hypothetical protein